MQRRTAVYCVHFCCTHWPGNKLVEKQHPKMNIVQQKKRVKRSIFPKEDHLYQIQTKQKMKNHKIFWWSIFATNYDITIVYLASNYHIIYNKLGLSWAKLSFSLGWLCLSCLPLDKVMNQYIFMFRKWYTDAKQIGWLTDLSKSPVNWLIQMDRCIYLKWWSQWTCILIICEFSCTERCIKRWRDQHIHQDEIGTSGPRSSRLAFEQSTGNNVSGH